MSGSPPIPNVRTLEPGQASTESREVYEEFHRRMGFPSPPNFILTLGHSSAAARGTWELIKNVLLGGRLPRWQKELVILAVSRDRDCRYCTAAHTACCTMLGVKAEHMVRDLTAIPDPVLRDSLLFAVKAARGPQSLSVGDFDGLRGHGFTDAEITELIGTAALATYLTIVADATGMEPDAMIGG